MKKLIQINSVCNGSTGKIMGDIQREALHNGYETISIYGRRKGYQDIKCIKVGGPLSFFNHILFTTILDMHGLGSYFKTTKRNLRVKFFGHYMIAGHLQGIVHIFQ